MMNSFVDSILLKKTTFEILRLTDKLKQILSLYKNSELADPVEIGDK